MPKDKKDIILIVDDDWAQVKTLTDIFTDENFSVHAAANGDEALHQCRKQEIPVAIVDLRLPDVGGVELLNQMKKINPRIMVIIHTAYASVDAAIGAVNEDAFAFVPKMNDVADLIGHVHRAYHHYYAGHSNELQIAVEKRTHDLETAKQLYQNLFENTPSMYLTTTYDGQIIRINDFGASQLGYTKEELITKSITELIFVTDRPGFSKTMVSFLGSDNELEHGELRMVCKNGAKRWVNKTVRKSTNIENQPVLLYVCEDISAKKKAELEIHYNQVLQEVLNKILTTGISGGTLENQLGAALDILLEVPQLPLKKSGGIFLTGSDGKHLKLIVQRQMASELLVTCANVAFGQCMCGRAALMKKIQFSNSLDHRHETTYSGIQEHGHYNVPILAKEKVLGVIVLYLEPGYKKDAHEVMFLESIANTLAILIEKSLYEEQLKIISQAIEQSPSLIFITDIDGYIEYVNPCFLSTTGYQSEEVIGKKPSFLKSGEQSRQVYRELWETILKGKTWRGEVRNLHKDKTSFWEEKQVSPMFDTEGKIIRFLSLGKDVTHQKALEKQLRQSQKLETIGTLAGGIAHDFNNILTPIFGYLDLANMDVVPGSTTELCIKQVHQGAERARDLVKQILNFSRRSEHEKKILYLFPLIKEVSKLLAASLSSRIEIKLNMIGEQDTILADSTQIHQLIMNLATNAAHAMLENGGTLSITLEYVNMAVSNPKFPTLVPGTYIRLTMEDTGVGMAREVCERIFEPFYTTKGVNEGTGLGLSVVHGIVADHNGEIFVNSTPGSGTTFDVFLPSMEVSSKADLPAGKESVKTGAGHILFVDDEKTIIDLATQVLQKLGYQVTTTSNSLKALDIFKSAPDKYDLLITDQTMPGMTGMELAEKILALRPGFPIVLATGYSKSITNKTAVAMGIRGFLAKPFHISQLANTVFELIENTQSKN